MDNSGESEEFYQTYATPFVDDGFKSLEQLARAELSDFSTVPGGAAGKSLVRRDLEQAAQCFPPPLATLKAALSDASTTVGYVMEAHGTGTGLGDPIEISSISAIVKKSGHKTCSVCGIKGNVGHTESTAGVANVIEVIGLLKLGEVALNVQLRTLNPQVRQVRAEVLHPSVDTNLMYRGRTQTGGASSFGWSGIIAHGVFQYEKCTEMRSKEGRFTNASLYRNC